MTQQEAVVFALQNLFTPVLNLSISSAGGSAQGQQYFEVPFLVRQFKTEYYPTTITPSSVTSGSTNTLKWNQTLPSKENYTYSMSTEQNSYTYVGANTPAPVDILNDSDCLWWLIPFATKVNINVQHTATLNPAVDTFPVVFKFQWIGYRLNNDIMADANLLYAIIDTLRK